MIDATQLSNTVKPSIIAFIPFMSVARAYQFFPSADSEAPSRLEQRERLSEVKETGAAMRKGEE